MERCEYSVCRKIDGTNVQLVRQGNGRFMSSLGDVYEGEWSQDHMHGLGTYTDHMGWSFTGSLSRGRPVSGMETCSDGTCFDVTYSHESDS